jgi:Zinc knuckle
VVTPRVVLTLKERIFQFRLRILLAVDSLIGRCFRCGEKGHFASSCLNATVCFRCNGLGHIAKYCSQPPKPSLLSKSSNPIGKEDCKAEGFVRKTGCKESRVPGKSLRELRDYFLFSLNYKLRKVEQELYGQQEVDKPPKAAGQVGT